MASVKFRLEITCDSAAFGDGPMETSQEIRRLLSLVSPMPLHFSPEDPTYLFDFNGNRVGFYHFTTEDEQPLPRVRVVVYRGLVDTVQSQIPINCSVVDRDSEDEETHIETEFFQEEFEP